MSEPRSGTSVREGRLYRDLYLDHRDAMYRAMTFIARRGGPPLTGDTEEVLTGHRERAAVWLLAQDRAEELLAEYERFLQTWSPVFPDRPGRDERE